MARIHQKPIFVLSGILVPLLTLIGPSWISIRGVGPSWAVLWLLPWALEDGPLSGLIAGLCLALILDAISLGGISHIPSLMILGWWWGQLGIRRQRIDRSFNLGLLAWIGSFVVGISFWAQILFINFRLENNLMNTWALNTLIAQVIVTGLLAPMISSLLLLFFRKKFKI